MGLIGIGSPQLIDLTKDKTDSPVIFDCGFVIVATTAESHVKLFYRSSDHGKLLKQLLIDNDIEESIASTILKEIGKYIANDLNGDNPAAMAKALPGVMQLRAKHPETGQDDLLWGIVITLNDQWKWKREDIADWIENTFDTNQIAFNPVEEVEDEKGSLSEFAKVVTIKRIL